jgi:catabolite regulation protein CreA
MTNKTYKSAMGKTVDLGALQITHENVKAVGNMNVNARGDLVNEKNKSIASKNQQVNRQYNRQNKGK